MFRFVFIRFFKKGPTDTLATKSVG